MKRLQQHFLSTGSAGPKVYTQAHADVKAGFKAFEKRRNSTMAPSPWRKKSK